ncbi:MAG: HD-GYP domain-containing protein [Chloroflexia bacterium]
MSFLDPPSPYAWSVLFRILEMLSGNGSLAEVLTVIADAACELTEAWGGLCILLPTGRSAEYYGGEEAIRVAPLLLEALEHQDPPLETPSPHTTLVLHASEARTLHALATPIPARWTIRGTVAGLYEEMPDESASLILSLLAHQAGLAIDRWHLDAMITERYISAIQALASAIDARDPSTHRHSQAVTDLSVALARELGLSEDEVRTIRDAAILHDIGKIGISEEILFKPGPLTPGERAVVEAHPVVGASILLGIPYMQHLIPLVRHHHERYDGTGYPDHIAGEQIPLGAQILAIADAFDAITTERPYHRGLSIPEACDLLRQESGSAFAPHLVEAFVQMILRRLPRTEREGD